MFLVLSSCREDDANQPVLWQGKTMGTTYTIKFNQAPDGPVLPSQDEVEKILKAINQSMSTYIPDSEISQINNSLKANEVHKISRDFSNVLSFSLRIAKKTDGLFDPTIMPLVRLWGFGPDGKRKVPSDQEVEEAKAKVGYGQVVHNDKESEVMFLKPKMSLDFSASAKGYAVDKISEFLTKRRIVDHMVEIGGEVRTAGKNNGKPWNIAIETPDPNFTKKSIQRVIPLVGLSLATSGNYRNFFTENGKSYAHTMDYRTGRPVKGIVASVTVLSKDSCMDADGWATALMAMGPEKGIEFTKKYSIAAYFIYAPDDNVQEGFKTYESIEFKRILGQQKIAEGKK